MMRQEIDQDVGLDKMDDTSGDENLYRELIVNNTAKIETTLSQMEQLSIPSNIINYVQNDKHPKNIHTISVRPINKAKNIAKSKHNERKIPTSEVEFKNTSDRLKEEYLDRYEEVKSEILSTTKVWWKCWFKHDLFRQNKHSKGK